MATLAGIKTQTNSKGVLTHIIIDLKKRPEAISQLALLGYIPKTQIEIEHEEFEKEWNDPTNLTLDECIGKLHEKIATWKWEK